MNKLPKKNISLGRILFFAILCFVVVLSSFWSSLLLTMAMMTPICLMMGRDLRGNTILPKLCESISFETVRDIAFGYLGFLLMTLFHECGHAIAFKLLYGAQSTIVLGSLTGDDPEFFSCFNHALSIQGFHPARGLTSYMMEDWENITPIKNIWVSVAGPLCGTLTQLMLKKIFHNPERPYNYINWVTLLGIFCQLGFFHECGDGPNIFRAVMSMIEARY